MTGRCATCKWWSSDAACELTRGGDATGVSYWNAPKDSKACAVGAYGYEAVLVTKPDFGCVQWEKEKE